MVKEAKSSLPSLVFLARVRAAAVQRVSVGDGLTFLLFPTNLPPHHGAQADSR